MSLKRLQHELADQEVEPLSFIRFWKEDRDYYNPPHAKFLTVHAFIMGPEGSLYEGGKFVLKIQVPFDYPMKPARFTFQTPMHHPNITEDGTFCPAIEHCPAMTLQKMLLLIMSIMIEPRIDDCVNMEAAEMYLVDRDMYNTIVSDQARRTFVEGKGKKRMASALE